MTLEHTWLAVGLLGQGLFSARFLIQWIASEQKKQSVIPVHFWYFSIGGGVMLLLYAIYRVDPVFIIGQSAGLVVYLRNLYFIHRQPRPASEGALHAGELTGEVGASPSPPSPV